jgi:glutaredoxin-like YruB-family protein
MEVKIYTTPKCSWCKKTKAFLEENEVSFEEIDVSEDDAASKEMIKKSGQMSVPVLDIDGTIIVGFDQKNLKKALKL